MHKVEDLKQNTSEPSQLVLSMCDLARDFTEAGDYEAAAQALSDVWRRVGERPDLEWLDERTSIEVLHRVGVLTGWLGSLHQVGGAQEQAKDLISEAISRAEAKGYREQVLDAQVDLAICYWRSGGFAEAGVLLDEVLEGLTIDDNITLRARALVNRSTVEVSCGRMHEACAYLTAAAPLVESCRSHFFKGRFHGQMGLVLRNIGTAGDRTSEIDRALVEYAAADYHFEQAGNQRHQAMIRINLGYLFFSIGKLPEALEHLERARHLCVIIKSRGHVASIDDARAQVFLAQGRNEEAELTARSAVSILRQGDEAALLVEAMTTHGRALARLGKASEARSTLARAVAAAERAGDLTGAGKAYLSLIEELANHLPASELIDYYQKADHVLGDTLEPNLAQRLRVCMRLALAATNKLPPVVPPGSSLKSEVLAFEGELIRKALVESSGSITKAARLLGITHQGLNFILGDRHQSLTHLRKAPRVRRRSIIKKSKQH